MDRGKELDKSAHHISAQQHYLPSAQEYLKSVNKGILPLNPKIFTNLDHISPIFYIFLHFCKDPYLCTFASFLGKYTELALFWIENNIFGP